MEWLTENGEAAVAAFVLAFIALDVVTGFAKAAHNREISSTAMRQGLYHKVGMIGALALAYLCQLATIALDLPEGFNAVYAGVAVYLVLVEVASVLENLCELSPELASSPIAALVGSKPSEGGDADD